MEESGWQGANDSHTAWCGGDVQRARAPFTAATAGMNTSVLSWVRRMSNAHNSVLIVEDNAIIAAQIGDYLSAAGLIVDYAADGRAALALAQARQFDVIVLDLNLPDMDGLDVCRLLPKLQRNHVPVLMLTARDTIDDKIEGFASGADDYLTKPFSLREVLVRCRVLARRHLLHSPRLLTIGSLTICRASREVRRDGSLIHLSEVDFQILLALAEAFPAAMSRSELLRRCWGDVFPDSDVLKAHVYTLRLALDKPFSSSLIRTVHGVGYRLQMEA